MGVGEWIVQSGKKGRCVKNWKNIESLNCSTYNIHSSGDLRTSYIPILNSVGGLPERSYRCYLDDNINKLAFLYIEYIAPYIAPHILFAFWPFSTTHYSLIKVLFCCTNSKPQEKCFYINLVTEIKSKSDFSFWSILHTEYSQY